MNRQWTILKGLNLNNIRRLLARHVWRQAGKQAGRMDKKRLPKNKTPKVFNKGTRNRIFIF